MRDNTRNLTITALMAAIVFLSTMFFSIPILFGYINLGDAAIYLAAFILGPKYGFIAAALGASLADYSLGFTQYILTTILVKGLMAYIAAKMNNGNKMRVIGCIIGGIIMVLGYYVTEVIIYGSKISPLANIPWNSLQFVVGMIIALILIKPLKNIIRK